MSLLRPVARSIEAPTSAWGDMPWSGDRAWVAQVGAGVGVALVYLALVGAELDQAATAAAAAALAVGLVWPVAGLTILAFVMPMREPEVFQPIYFNATLAAATAFGCLLRLPGDRLPLRVHPGMVLVIGYAIYSAIGVLPQVSGHPEAWTSSAANELVRIVAGMTLFVIASFLFRWVAPGPVIAVALAGAGFAAALAILGYFRIDLLAPVSAGLLQPAVGGERASGGFSNANYLGFFAAQALLLAFGSWSMARPGWLRRGLVIGLILLAAAVVLSFSRSAYLASASGLVLLVALRNPKAAVVLALVGIVAAVIAYPTFLEARLGADALDPGETLARLQSENSRRVVAAAGLTMFANEPLFGIGFGVFHFVSPDYIGASPATYSHNQYINVLAEQGLVGALMVGGIVVALATALVRSTHPLRGAAIAMLAAYLVQSAFINSTTSFQISGLTWLTMAAALSPTFRPSNPALEES